MKREVNSFKHESESSSKSICLWENSVELFYSNIECRTLQPLCLCKASPVEWTAKLREINELSTCSNAPFCSENSLLLCVCLFVAFCQISVYCVEWQFFVDCMNSDPGSSLRSAQNVSVKIRKLFVKREVNSFKHESGSSSKSIFFCGRMQLSCFRAILSAGHFSRFACAKTVL